jgi:hypothetical protein
MKLSKEGIIVKLSFSRKILIVYLTATELASFTEGHIDTLAMI